MGIAGISIWQLLILLAIVVVIFGTKRLRNIGGDLGGAMKSFRSAMRDDDDETQNQDARKRPEDPQVVDQLGETRKNTDPAQEADRREQKARDSS